MKLLIVDDSRVMRLLVRRTLRQAGFGKHEVVEAESGAQALEVIADENPDLVLSDWNMPGMTGLELLNKLREDGSRIRFGLVTTEGTDEVRQQAQEAGALFLLTKPFTPETFEAALEGVLN